MKCAHRERQWGEQEGRFCRAAPRSLGSNFDRASACVSPLVSLTFYDRSERNRSCECEYGCEQLAVGRDGGGRRAALRRRGALDGRLRAQRLCLALLLLLFVVADGAIVSCAVILQRLRLSVRVGIIRRHG